MNETKLKLILPKITITSLLIKLRLLFINYSKVYFKKKRKALKLNFNTQTLKISNFNEQKFLKRRYTKRYYRRIFKKRYERDLKIDNPVFSVWVNRHAWNKPYKARISYKAFFHIKIFFNINEFLMYDFYNFHKTLLNNSLGKKKIPQKVISKKPWKKLNFFYYIRYSVDTFRTHTLQFFRFKFRTDRKTTLFFNSFRNVTPLSYVWFFEYSIPYFLVKVKFAESVGQGLLLVTSNVVFINRSNWFDRWDTINPGDVLQMPFNLYLLTRLRWIVLRFFDFFRKTKKFFKRTVLRAKKYRTKMPNMTAKANHLINTKCIGLRLLESDYKSLTIVLIPYVNPTIYYSALTLFWLNFWNFRINTWKYEI